MQVYSVLIFAVICLGALAAFAAYSIKALRQIHRDAVDAIKADHEGTHNAILDTTYKIFLKCGVYPYAMKPELYPAEPSVEKISEEDEEEMWQDLEKRVERIGG